jgi:hypothetical protein
MLKLEASKRAQAQIEKIMYWQKTNDLSNAQGINGDLLLSALEVLYLQGIQDGQKSMINAVFFNEKNS